MKSYEAKIRGIEEEHKLQLSQLGPKDHSPRPDFGIKAQYEMFQQQMEKERQEMGVVRKQVPGITCYFYCIYSCCFCGKGRGAAAGE